jgi:hypothetical protein
MATTFEGELQDPAARQAAIRITIQPALCHNVFLVFGSFSNRPRLNIRTPAVSQPLDRSFHEALFKTECVLSDESKTTYLQQPNGA